MTVAAVLLVLLGTLPVLLQMHLPPAIVDAALWRFAASEEFSGQLSLLPIALLSRYPLLEVLGRCFGQWREESPVVMDCCLQSRLELVPDRFAAIQIVAVMAFVKMGCEGREDGEIDHSLVDIERNEIGCCFDDD